MTTLAEDRIYDLAEIVLSKRGEFTVDELKNDLDKQGYNGVTMEDLMSVLESYRDNGIIVEHGFTYSLSELYVR